MASKGRKFDATKMSEVAVRKDRKVNILASQGFVIFHTQSQDLKINIKKGDAILRELKIHCTVVFAYTTD